MDTETPSWIASLREDAELGEALELSWLDPEQQRAIREQWLQVWDQVPFDDEFHARCRERVERSVPLAVGPCRYRRSSGSECALVVLHDPSRPRTPWVSLSNAMPSALWIRGGTTGSELRDRLAPYVERERGSLAELPRTLRVFKPIQVDDPSVVTRAVEAFDLWMDDASWANGHADDPWIDLEDDVGMMQLHFARERARQEHHGRFPSTGFRSLWSRSAMTIQQLPFGAWVFELRYAPADDAETLRELEDGLGTTLPAHDLPVDLVASILRDVSADPRRVDELCEDAPEAMLAKISCEPAEPTSFALMERWMERSAGDEELGPSLAELASGHRFESLLFELALLRSADDELRQGLEDFLRPRRPEQVLAEEAE